MNDFSASQKQGLHGYGDLLDLTSHQRNLLLIRPLLKLDFNKLMHTQEDGSYLLEGIDTNYLCLAALYFMMEGAAIQQGYMLGEVREHLKMIAGSMKHTLDEDSRGRIADIVLDALSNKSNKYVEHRESYFHAPSGETRVLNFRLIRFEADFEENYRYSPTREGYLVLMGMLDLEVEDYQVLIEKMLVYLMENGRFDQAFDLANRALSLSVEHRQIIREHIRQAARSPGSVKWSTEIQPRLTSARKHVQERQVIDFSMRESLTEKIRGLDNPDARAPLSKLHGQLDAANLQRMKLLTEISRAGEDFLEGQVSGFRARRSSGLPDLESRILPDLMARPISEIAEFAEALLLSLYPPVPQMIPDLSNLFHLLLERRNSPQFIDADEDDVEIEAFQEIPMPFPAELIAKVHQWLDSKMHGAEVLHLHQLIQQAEAEGLSFMERKAVAYELYRAFADSESRYKNRHAEIDGEYETSVVSGDNLRFDIAEVNEEKGDDQQQS